MGGPKGASTSATDRPVVVKVVVVGDGAVGKTSLLLTYSLSKFPVDYIPTVFDNYETKQDMEVAGEDGAKTKKSFYISLWDTAGQEEYDHIRPLAYPETSVFLLCFALNDESTLLHMKTKWIPELEQHCPDTPYILVGTKSDLRSLKKTKEEMHAHAKELGAVDYIECSAKKQINVEEAFLRAAKEYVRQAPNPAASRSPSRAQSQSGAGGCCMIQ